MPDKDLLQFNHKQLLDEVIKLRNAIREHRDSTGHELCWHHPKLWNLLPEKTDPKIAIPEWPEFLKGCIRYRTSLDETGFQNSSSFVTENNKEILKKANASVTNGDNEGFLSYCTEETEWNFVGDKILKGKEAVKKYMATAYAEPPKFKVENLIAEGDFVVATGKISMKDENGRRIAYSYCDVWKFRDGKLDQLTAFVIADETKA
jgi:uncharacterized protein